MENKWEWTDALAIEFSVFCMKFDANNNNQYLDAFKASKQPKRDWQIESFHDTKDRSEWWKLSGDKGRYTHDGSSFWSLEDMLDDEPNHCVKNGKIGIHSVRRLSDGEVFTVGDFVSTLNVGGDGFSDKIKHFTYTSGVNIIDVYFEGMKSAYSVSVWLKNAHKAPEKPKPLFTTEDGYLADNPEEMLLYVSQFKIRERKAKNMSELQNKRFKSKGKAEEYILLNKPCLSVNQVVDGCESASFDSIYIQIEDLKQLAKSKIDKQV